MVGVREDAASMPPITPAAAMSAILPRRILFHPPLNTPSPVSSSPAIPLTPLNDPSPANAVNDQDRLSGHRRHQSQTLESTLVKRIGAGLSNLGNTCFLNSVLQCLTYTPPLAAYLQANLHKGSCRIVGFCAMCALESHVKQALSGPGRVVSPNHIVKNLRSISRSFQLWRQEDAHEYMRYLIEALQKCCPKEASSVAGHKNYVERVFGGRLRSQVKCTQCSHCSNTYDPFLDLSLEIVKAESLVKALARFTAVEVLDGDNKYHCNKCKKKVRAFKQFTIDHAPHVLTVQFKRFSASGGFGGKIDKKVHFERTLDMKPFVNSEEDGGLKYSLYAVLVHSGWSTHSGHYYCFVRTASDMWHILDDSRVSQVSEKTVLEQKAYILFYMRDKTTKSSSVMADGKTSRDIGGKVNGKGISVNNCKETAETCKINGFSAPENAEVLPTEVNGNFASGSQLCRKTIETEVNSDKALQEDNKGKVVEKDKGSRSESRNGCTCLKDTGCSCSTLAFNENGDASLKAEIQTDKISVTGNGHVNVAKPLGLVSSTSHVVQLKPGHENVVESSNGSTSFPNGSAANRIMNRNAMLAASLEPVVPRWAADTEHKENDGVQVSTVTMTNEKPAHCGHLLDEWDEEYDKGKRKKVKNKLMGEANEIGKCHLQYKRRKTSGETTRNPFQVASNGKSNDGRKSIALLKRRRKKQWAFGHKLFLKKHPFKRRGKSDRNNRRKQ